ncbi:ATP-dependent protease La Type II [Candidatus Terasakiella magnetica]|uniref:endopeptidase La n=1 Tax=Candidatus Terasakiella magnetica TaxID=1867952 RepID=A0A1C3RJB5_9PROT|nr:ATP-binding protein [Candidatus Terasakiella magnetica]SCA57358.1 ATP-dependent protease La Type II [Candidatus Terasakiella magnetica]
MGVLKTLKRKDLYRACDPKIFEFTTTDELDDLDQFVGQDRALEAAKFAIGMQGNGYNLFAFGPRGTGKSSLVLRLLKDKAQDKPVPKDWVYVNNFDLPHKPKAISFEPGKARGFADAMDQLVDDLKATIPQAFEKEEYRQRRDTLEQKYKDVQEKAFGDFQERGEKRNIGLLRTPTGFALVPLKDGAILKPEEFQSLSQKDQDARKEAIDELQEELTQIVEDLPRMEKEYRLSVRELNREVTQYAVEHQIMELRKAYKGHELVEAYLDDVEEDVIETADDFLPQEQNNQVAGLAMLGAKPPDFSRFQVNVIVDHDEKAKGAPIVEEDHPTLPNVVGRIESIATYGTQVTDFTLIKAGALHQANGGYLMLDIHKILMQPFAWEALKRILHAKSIRIESAAESYGVGSTMMLEPEPIPLDIKVVLLGDPQLYYLLNHLDPDFHELFKVAADFDDRMERSNDTMCTYARLIATFVRQEGLLALDPPGVARIVEHGSRLCEDSERLTTHMASIVDLVREADYWCREDKQWVISKSHIEKAIDAKIYRSDRIRERILDEIHRGTIHIDTEGEVVGQINGLAVLQLDHFMFGRPSRISCTVRMGRGEIVNIEREVALSGPLHSKGVLILTSFLAHRFAKDRPLSLTANIVFEQSYSNIDGDSASSTELYSLLSALADVPIKQSLAVTGSVDQYGHVQAIGGVNEKIEGFFDVCMARGLNGEQGVLIPQDNVKHLMLREDVVEACERGDFHIYPVKDIDQGIEILTGVPAGELDEHGQYPIGTINRLAAVRLMSFTRRWFEMARVGEH